MSVPMSGCDTTTRTTALMDITGANRASDLTRDVQVKKYTPPRKGGGELTVPLQRDVAVR